MSADPYEGPVVLPDDPGFGPEVQVDYPGYRSTRLRAPKRPLVTLPEELHALDGPVFGEDCVERARRRPHAPARRGAARGADRRQRPRPRRGRQAGARRARRGLAGERGRPLPPRRRPAPGAARPELLRGRDAAHRRRRPLPLRRRSSRAPTPGATTRTPGGRPHPLLGLRPRVHPAARHPDVLPGRPAVRLRPDLPLGPRPEGARAADRALRPRHDAPEWALGYRWDIVLGAAGAGTTPMEEQADACTKTPSQTVGPFYAIGLCRRPENELVAAGPAAIGCGRAPRRRGRADRRRDGRDLGRRRRAAGAAAAPTRDGRFSFVVAMPARCRQAPHLEVYVFARGLLRHQRTRMYFPDEAGERRRPGARGARAADRATLVARREDGAPALRHPHAGRRGQTVFFAH